MKTLAIDIETYNSVDLKKAGVYKYAEAEDFEILLFGYAFDDDPAQVVELANKEKLPDEVLEALYDPAIIKTAFNAAFERICISNHFDLPEFMQPEEWRCSSVHSLFLGLPGSLAGSAKALNLEQQKDSRGTYLINYFSKPCTATKKNGGRTRNLPEHNPEKWQMFKDYCAQDVEVERAVRKKLERFPVPDKELQLYALDQRINDRGVMVDMELVQNALQLDAQYKTQQERRIKELTLLENPNSPAQLKDWLYKRTGHKVEQLTKDTVPELIKKFTDPEVKEVLEIQKELSKTSVKKYVAMDTARCADDRVRGLLQFYGANRTGRWAGRLVQVQNLPKNKMPDLDEARGLLKAGEFELMEMLYDSLPGLLSQLIRTAFTAPRGYRYIVSDFSAIEARVIAWLAGEKWRLDVFNGHGKIYEASAAAMFKVPLESIDKSSPLRAKGKIAELACGFGGGVGALKAMDNDNVLSEEELQTIIHNWRAANPRIKALWRKVETAALTAIKERRTVKQGLLEYRYEAGILFIRLPSGRELAYPKAKIGKDPKFNKPSISYYGKEQGKAHYQTIRTYGGKLTENIVQAIARDCLAEAMLRLDSGGIDRIVMHVHDEVILEVLEDKMTVQEINEIMGQPIAWAPGLPLGADGFETRYYMKD